MNYYERNIGEFILYRDSNERLSFSKSEMDMISKLGSVYSQNLETLTFKPYPLHESLTIYKFVDEWYTVYHFKGNNIFKCDQFDGLLRCLSSEYR